MTPPIPMSQRSHQGLCLVWCASQGRSGLVGPKWWKKTGWWGAKTLRFRWDMVRGYMDPGILQQNDFDIFWSKTDPWDSWNIYYLPRYIFSINCQKQTKVGKYSSFDGAYGYGTGKQKRFLRFEPFVRESFWRSNWVLRVYIQYLNCMNKYIKS